MKYGLVLEGGSRKGLYVAGVLDAMIEKNIEFDYVIGVSSGAQVAANFISGQQGRSKLQFTPESVRKKTHKKGAIIRDGIKKQLLSMIYKFSYDRNMPFNFDTFFSSPTEFEICATCMETGQAVYFAGNHFTDADLKYSEGRRRRILLDRLYASSAFPVLFPSKEMGGLHYCDGCVSDSVPFIRAYEKGCGRVVVVSTKVPDDKPTDFKDMDILMSPIYKHSYPKLYAAMQNRYENYYKNEGKLSVMESLGRAFVFRPEKKLCELFENSPDEIDATYTYGYESGIKKMEELKAYLQDPDGKK